MDYCIYQINIEKKRDYKKKMRKLFYKLFVCRKKVSHLDYNLMALKLELWFSDSKYYYFIDLENNKGYKVLKIENNDVLDILEDLD